MSELAARFRFFHEHAGYIVGRRAVAAISLARAEIQARREGISFEWEDELEPWDADPECGPAPTYVLCCLARDASGQVVASLGMVGVNRLSDPYLRVVEAELALEALHELHPRGRFGARCTD